MKYPGEVWLIDHWIKFDIQIIVYQNIITFLEAGKLLFLTTIEIDFTQIPLYLHGRGNSNNLNEYLANNNDNSILILQFIDYFITIIHKFKYSSGQNLSFELIENDKWQNINLIISKPYISENNYVENDYVDNYFQ